jgi:hypothetical protein
MTSSFLIHCRFGELGSEPGGTVVGAGAVPELGFTGRGCPYPGAVVVLGAGAPLGVVASLGWE